MRISEVRRAALALPEAVELDHHGIPSFRVGGRIFATLPDDTHVRVMVDERDIRAAVAAHPTACAEFWWGSRLACVVIDVGVAPRRVVAELLVDAWRRKAPRRLVREFDASSAGG